MKHQEHIVAIHASKISHTGDNLQLVVGEITGADIIIGQRAHLEQNPAFRQIIPYTVLRCGDRIAAYRRTPKGGENRLHGMVSIGFGGHIDLADVSFDEKSVIDLTATIKEGAEREIREELNFDDSVTIVNFTTLPEKIVSNMSAVDAVHIGLVTIIDIDSDKVSAAEEQLNFIGFHTVAELEALDPLENWTKGLLPVLA